MQKPVLVVDDDADCRLLLQSLLEHHGHLVEMAANGLEALSKLTQVDYAAVLLDYNMPGPDGLTVLHDIQGRYPSVPVILITGDASHELAAQALAAGARACLSKPIDFSEVHQVLTCGL
jgi:CheY-like chemotaxis protein